MANVQHMTQSNTNNPFHGFSSSMNTMPTPTSNMNALSSFVPPTTSTYALGNMVDGLNMPGNMNINPNNMGSPAANMNPNIAGGAPNMVRNVITNLPGNMGGNTNMMHPNMIAGGNFRGSMNVQGTLQRAISTGNVNIAANNAGASIQDANRSDNIAGNHGVGAVSNVNMNAQAGVNVVSCFVAIVAFLTFS